MRSLVVVGTHNWPDDLTNEIGHNIAELDQGTGIQVIHPSRNTKFERALTTWCNVMGWTDTPVKDVTRYLNKVDGVLFFQLADMYGKGKSPDLKAWVDSLDPSIIVQEFLA